MASDDVPPDDMFLFGSSPDPFDAAVRGESADPAVDALVHDLRAAYLSEGSRPRSAALTAFAGTGDEVPAGAVPGRRRPAEPVAPAVPIGRRVAVGVAAFAATLTGKVVLGGAVAAGTLGGLHATEVVDVPLLPRSPQSETAPSTVPDLPEPADPLTVLVGPPAQPPAGATDRAPVEPSTPAVVVPQPSSGAGGPASTPGVEKTDPDDGRAGETPPVATPAPAPGPEADPAPTPERPAPQPPAEETPERSPASAPEQGDAGAEQPADPAEQPPAPTADEEKSSARP